MSFGIGNLYPSSRRNQGDLIQGGGTQPSISEKAREAMGGAFLGWGRGMQPPRLTQNTAVSLTEPNVVYHLFLHNS